MSPRRAAAATAAAALAAMLAVATPAPADDAPAQVSVETLMADGAKLYRSECARCHGRNGEGQRNYHDAAPRLAGSAVQLSVDRVAVQVIRGGAYMPPFASLTDRQIAAVATYVRNSFGNDYGPVAEADVASRR